MLALLALLTAAAPTQQGRYLMMVGGVPAGTVAFTLEGTRYTYTSTHFFRRSERTQRVTLTLDSRQRVDGRVPEILFLSSRREAGCVAVLEELRGAPEQVCLDDLGRGRIDDAEFTIAWDSKGRLAELTLASGVRFTAWTAPPSRSGEPFDAGFPVTGSGRHAQLEPEQLGVRQPDGVEGLGAGAAGNCLDVARERAHGHPELEVVLGVVVEDGRAWPHAWLRELPRSRDIDPTLAAGDPLLSRRSYLAFPRDQAGRLYLELLAGSRRVRLAPRPFSL